MNAARSRFLMAGSLLSLLALLSGLLLHYAPVPFFWILETWALLCFFFLTRCFAAGTGNAPKLVFLNLWLILTAAGFAEAFFAYQAEHPRNDGTAAKLKSEFKTKNANGFIVRHPFLGYVPVADQQVEHSASYADGSSFTALYTINPDGLRKAAPADDKYVPDASLLFFGCSYTFGEGVNDAETLPYQTGKALDGKYEIYNFGFEGYGPTQMLSALQHGIVEKTAKITPVHILYQAIFDHVNRVSKEQPWIRFGPKYAIENGVLVSKGQFGDVADQPVSAWTRRLGRSYLFNRIVAAAELDSNMRLYFRIVEQSIATAKKIYPNARFHILFWNTPYPNGRPKDIRRMVEGFKDMDADVMFISEVIPDFDSNRAAYIIKNNGHPNGTAYAKIAAFLADRIK